MENNQKSSEPTSEFLKDIKKDAGKPAYKKRKDLLDGYKFRNSFEVDLNPYTKMVCSLYESESKEGLFRCEQKIGYNRVIYDGNLIFVVAETLKELGDPFVPENLRPRREKS